jgi:hypothetical protein
MNTLNTFDVTFIDLLTIFRSEKALDPLSTSLDKRSCSLPGIWQMR